MHLARIYIYVENSRSTYCNSIPVAYAAIKKLELITVFQNKTYLQSKRCSQNSDFFGILNIVSLFLYFVYFHFACQLAVFRQL